MKRNKVSIIMNCFNGERYLKQSLRSVLKQTYKNLEIIIIYDDNNKKDLIYIKKIQKTDSRIKLLINKNNIGAGLSRNRGIKISKGKFLAFLDADDFWHKDKIEKQINFMHSNNYLISHTTYLILNNNRIVATRAAKNFYILDELIYSCDIGLSSVIIKKKVFSNKIKFSNLKTKEDYVLWLKILLKGIKIGGLDEKLVYWRKLDNSLSSNSIQKIYDAFKVYNTYMKFNVLKSLYFVFCLSFNYIKKIV